MKVQRYGDGDYIYREHDPGDAAYVIKSGKVEIFREVDGRAILLGVLGPGKIFGEVGVIRNRPRSTTMRARGDTVTQRISKDSFLTAFGGEDSPALPLLRMLCERLANTDEQLADTRPSFERVPTGEIGSIRLLPDSQLMREQIGGNGVVVSKLPYRVGRRATPVKSTTAKPTGLSLMAQASDRMSPEHFAIENIGGFLMVHDLGSHLGTLVNGEPVTRLEGEAMAPLGFGENEVVAGGVDSPFRFRLLVERAAKD